MKKKYIIIGGGAQAKYVIDILNHYNKKGYVDGILEIENNPSYHGTTIYDVEVLGFYKDYLDNYPPEEYFVVICHSNNVLKEKIYYELKEYGYEFPSIIHPSVHISSGAKIGIGCIINPNVTILPFANIGNFVVIHSNSVIEHDCQIQDFTNIGPSVSFTGYVKVGYRAYIYANATMFPQVKIGDDAIVGAGSVVTKDVPEKAIVYGVPAKLVKFIEDL